MRHLPLLLSFLFLTQSTIAQDDFSVSVTDILVNSGGGIITNGKIRFEFNINVVTEGVAIEFLNGYPACVAQFITLTFE